MEGFIEEKSLPPDHQVSEMIKDFKEFRKLDPFAPAPSGGKNEWESASLRIRKNYHQFMRFIHPDKLTDYKDLASLATSVIGSQKMFKNGEDEFSIYQEKVGDYLNNQTVIDKRNAIKEELFKLKPTYDYLKQQKQTELKGEDQKLVEFYEQGEAFLFRERIDNIQLSELLKNDLHPLLIPKFLKKYLTSNMGQMHEDIGLNYHEDGLMTDFGKGLNDDSREYQNTKFKDGFIDIYRKINVKTGVETSTDETVQWSETDIVRYFPKEKKLVVKNQIVGEEIVELSDGAAQMVDKIPVTNFGNGNLSYNGESFEIKGGNITEEKIGIGFYLQSVINKNSVENNLLSIMGESIGYTVLNGMNLFTGINNLLVKYDPLKLPIVRAQDIDFSVEDVSPEPSIDTNSPGYSENLKLITDRNYPGLGPQYRNIGEKATLIEGKGWTWNGQKLDPFQGVDNKGIIGVYMPVEPKTKTETFPQLISKFADSDIREMNSNLESFKEKNNRPPKITFICAGNTCRSALAESIVKNAFGENIIVNSAGVSIRDKGGSPMKPESQVMACGSRGCDTSHSSKPLTTELTEGSDVVVFMTPELLQRAMKTQQLETVPVNWKALNIPDPWKPAVSNQKGVYRMETDDGSSGSVVPASKQMADYVTMSKSVLTQVKPIINNLGSDAESGKSVYNGGKKSKKNRKIRRKTVKRKINKIGGKYTQRIENSLGIRKLKYKQKKKSQKTYRFCNKKSKKNRYKGGVKRNSQKSKGLPTKKTRKR